VPSFVNYKRCTRLAAASNKVYQLLAHGRWLSPATPASSTTITGRHDIAEILLKVALNTINQIKSNHFVWPYQYVSISISLCTKNAFIEYTSVRAYRRSN